MAETHIYQWHEGIPSHMNSTMSDMHNKDVLLEKLNSRKVAVGKVEERTTLVALDDPS
jgi:hypothetical protein